MQVQARFHGYLVVVRKMHLQKLSQKVTCPDGYQERLAPAIDLGPDGYTVSHLVAG